MVSLTEKMDYLSRIKNSPKLAIFSNLISNKNVEADIVYHNLSETDEIYWGMVYAIHKNDKAEFLKSYDRKSTSKPNRDSTSPFVNDDFFIFSVILGVTKFGIEKTWINYIISIRTRNAITVTFENILTENFYSTSNLPEIIFIFLQLNDESRITHDFINFSYSQISTNIKLFENRSDFQIICALRSYDLIILLKETPSSGEISLLRQFNRRFRLRIKFLSWLIQIVLFATIIYLILKLSIYSPETVAMIEKYNYGFTILGSLGFSVAGNLVPIFRDMSQKLIMQMLGYPKQLIKEDNKN